ncbi:DnaJ domain-containing protein, partial [Myxococcota bacterium]|nr:DnaJ domain-containing protein [Myxococcota bacterium]
NIPPTKPPPQSGPQTQSSPPRNKGPEQPPNGQRPPSKSPEQPPNGQRPPSKSPEQPHSTAESNTPPKPPKALEGALALTPAHIDQIATVLYRSALLGATYARPQIRAIRIYFQKILDCSPAQLHRVRDILKKLQSQEFPLVPPPLDDLPALVPMLSYAKRLAFVHSILFLLGCKTLQTLERYRDFMSELAIELRIDPADVSLFNLFGIGSDEIQLSFQDCLRVLDVEMDATENDLRKAHRELVRRYHPDQFHSKGPEFVRLAERKMKEANMALEILLYRSDRGV